jgi:UDP-galactopyranose mutase
MNGGTRIPAVVCFSNLDWGYLRYRKQHLMERIARRTPVIYVNPPRAYKWRHPRRWGAVAAAAPGLRVYEPPVLPGMRESTRVRDLNYRMMAAALVRLLRPHTHPVLWIYSPHAAAFTQLLTPGLVVYDIADDYSVPTGSVLRGDSEARELEVLDRLERGLVPRADVVFCVSEPLRAKAMAAGARNVHLLPNGCDIEAYAEAPRPPRRSRYPLIGFVGTVAPRFDVELVHALARLRPDWRFEIVGPVSPLATVDASLSNLTWIGEVPYAEVPARIKNFDACVLPLRDIDYAYRSSPIQVFDYLAAGKPVVSSPVAQFEAWPSLVSIARGADGFAAALDEALRLDSVERQAQRRGFARQHSWDARVEAALAVVDGSARGDDDQQSPDGRLCHAPSSAPQDPDGQS